MQNESATVHPQGKLAGRSWKLAAGVVILTSLGLVAGIVGCDETPRSEPTDPPIPALSGAEFDAAETGSIEGVVSWKGPRPAKESFRSIEIPLTDKPAPPARDWANPNLPVVDKMNRLASAVVFLRGVDPRRGRKWDHEAVRVELSEQQFRVYQGEKRQRVGFVRRGDAVTLVSRDPVYHSVQGRGDAFFALALPDPEQTRSASMKESGVVELLSGAGYFWMRSYLLVDEHPYYTLTDSDGRYRLDGVPDGNYEVVAWHPNWRVQREERNPDNTRVQQVRFRTPLECGSRVRVEAGKKASVDLTLVPARTK